MRVAFLDIERLRGKAEVEFFDLSDFKNRRIHADDVTLWPRTICAAWKFQGERKVQFAAEWEWTDPADGAYGLAKATFEAYDEADVVVGHNIDGFDTKKLRSLWLENGLGEPSPFKSVDTLKVARSKLGMESNTLNALCVRLGIVAKTDRYDHESARRATLGVRADQRRIKRYNIGDVHASEALHDYLLGMTPNYPNRAMYDELTPVNGNPVCPRCGKPTVKQGVRRAVSYIYQQYQCVDGHWSSGTKMLRKVEAAKPL